MVWSLILVLKKKVDRPEIGCFLSLTGLTNSRISYDGFFSPLYLLVYDPVLFFLLGKKRNLSSLKTDERSIYNN